MTRFSNSFWNSEFCNFSGFDVLCKRMKDGKQITKDYSDFLKLRAQAQENYGKSLLKIAKAAGGKDEVGTMRKAWDSLRTQTENIGNAHIAAATAIVEETNRVSDFMETQREQRKKLEDNIRRIQGNIKILYRKTMDCKKICETRCREAEQATQVFNEGMRNCAAPKEMEKLKQKQTKALFCAEQADGNYRSAVDTLDQSRIQWEQETEKTCDDFQLLEEERIRYMRNSMWVASNFGSAVCVKEDELHEEVRKTLENCDVEADIQYFIRQRQTGSERPACIDYENFFGGLFEKNGNTIPTMSPRTTREGAAIAVNVVTPIQTHLNRSLRATPSSTDTIDAKTDNVTINELYDSLDNDNNLNKCRVLYDFEGRNDEELTLKEDEIVYLVHKETSDWWEVETKEGKKGYYPAAYLEVI